MVCVRVCLDDTAERRWALSAHPMSDDIDNLFALFQALHVSPVRKSWCVARRKRSADNRRSLFFVSRVLCRRVAVWIARVVAGECWCHFEAASASVGSVLNFVCSNVD